MNTRKNIHPDQLCKSTFLRLLSSSLLLSACCIAFGAQALPAQNQSNQTGIQLNPTGISTLSSGSMPRWQAKTQSLPLSKGTQRIPGTTGMPGSPTSTYGGSFFKGPNDPTRQNNYIGINQLNNRSSDGASVNGLGIGASRPNGIGAMGGRSFAKITPVGNGANGPLGTYGGSSFGSSAGGSVR